MNPFDEAVLYETRRQFFSRAARGLGGVALATLFPGDATHAAAGEYIGGQPGLPHFAPKAKRAVYMHMLGGPPQQDMFDYKPGLSEWYDKDLPESVRQGQRLTTMSSGQTRFPIAPSIYKFSQHGQSGAWVSELLPHTSRMVDDITIIKSLYTEQINHEPAITYIQTGSMIAGRPCTGAWLAYGLGNMTEDLPTFVVMTAVGSNPRAGAQAMSSKMWSSGFLPGKYSGVSLRSGADPVLFINNPDGVPRSVRRRMLDGLTELNQIEHRKIADPETLTRIAQYEMAYRMQASVPELTDLSKEPASVYDLYGEDARRPGSFAQCCLTTRRLLERGVRFVQIWLNGWDFHGNLPQSVGSQCKDIDQACYGFVQDLKQRGLFDDTLLVWGGEFGRTVYSQGTLTPENYGRDHHPRCFTMWMAGAGVKRGVVYGETDDFSYNIAKDPVHVRDLQATILQQFGIDHEKFTYRYQGLDMRLTGVEKAHVVNGVLL